MWIIRKQNRKENKILSHSFVYGKWQITNIRTNGHIKSISLFREPLSCPRLRIPCRTQLPVVCAHNCCLVRYPHCWKIQILYEFSSRESGVSGLQQTFKVVTQTKKSPCSNPVRGTPLPLCTSSLPTPQLLLRPDCCSYGKLQAHAVGPTETDTCYSVTID